LRVVLDTNTLIRAHSRAPSLARALLRGILQQDHRLVLSSEILAEVTRVLRYPRFQRLYGLTEAELLEYVQFLQSISVLIPLDHSFWAPLRDPSDLAILQTAIQGEADILCTSDNDFFEPPVAAFCAARGLKICREETLAQQIL
jgi:uncharacterized protein